MSDEVPTDKPRGCAVIAGESTVPKRIQMEGELGKVSAPSPSQQIPGRHTSFDHLFDSESQGAANRLSAVQPFRAPVHVHATSSESHTRGQFRGGPTETCWRQCDAKC